MQFDPRSLPVLVLATAALTGALGEAEAATPDALHATVQPDVADVLERTQTWRDVPGRIDELVRLGPAVIPELFELLVLWADPSRAATDGPDAARLVGIHKTMILTAFGRLPWDRTRAFLVDLSEERQDVERRTQAMHLLGRLGTSTELALLARLGSGTTPAEIPVERSVRDAFEDALALVLLRDPAAVEALSPLFRKAHPSLIESLVRCTGDTGTEAAALVLANVLGTRENVNALVLTQLASMVSIDEDRDETVARLVRDQLSRMDTRTVVLAALVATKLRDQEAVPVLMELMDRPEQSVHRAASQALGSITGRPYGTDRLAWIDWYDAELSWWQEGMQTDLARLQSGTFSEAASVIRRAAAHRLFADDVARMLVRGLDRREYQIVEMTCLALASVGSRAVLPELVECLEHTYASVRTAASKSLARITGKTLPADIRVWRRELGIF